MARLPAIFRTIAPKGRKKLISIDLGTRTTKAVLMEQNGNTLSLTGYAVLETPVHNQDNHQQVLTEHLQSIANKFAHETKQVAITLGHTDSLVRQVEMPPIPVDQIRASLNTNHRVLLNQDLPKHFFDCHVIPPSRQNTTPTDHDPKQNGSPKSLRQKYKVLVAAAKQQLIENIIQAAKAVDLKVDSVTPSLIGPVNAFERCQPESYAKEIIALVDIGFKHTSVCILDHGELVTNRVINLGGDHFTAGLADCKGISYAEAEGLKIGMAAELIGELNTVMTPLIREIRASLDFYEHQIDRPILQIYVSGATSRSEIMLQIMEADLMVKCKTWNPTNFLQIALPSEQANQLGELEHQLVVAVGSALSVF